MKLLADAHISRGMAAHLQSLGNDLLHASLLEPRLSDDDILRIASEQQRVILTADKDFGRLVFGRALPCFGVILLRLTAPSETERLQIFKRFWPVIEPNVPGHFLVLTDNAIRRTPLP